MRKRVLFSAVASHDPIANCADGAFLHVCRHYQPDKVYIYLTKEMLEHQESDERYTRALKLLDDFTNHSTEYELIERPEQVDVQLFDAFIPDFKILLNRINSENPDSEIIINVSSGSPAMKSSLLFLSKMMPFDMTAVQVSTPEKKQNTDRDTLDYDEASSWELNVDNLEGAVNRCKEEHYENTLAEIKKESICRQIDAYDYDAAVREAESIESFVNERAITLLKAASDRIRINPNTLKMLLTTEEKKLVLPVQSGDEIQLFEYMLWLRMKQKRGDTADFVRGLTPALFSISQKYLKSILKIDMTLYSVRTKFGSFKVTRAKLSNDEAGQELLKMLDEKYQGGFRDSSDLNSDICIELISYKTQDFTARDMFTSLREIEKKIRNPIAHDIHTISDEWLKSTADTGTREIMKIFEALMHKIMPLSKTAWESYDEMNKLIKAELAK